MAGLPFTPATTLSPFALLAPDARAQPDPAQQRQAAFLQATFQRDPPGQWGANKYDQTNHYTGMVSIAAKAYLDAIAAMKVRVLERKIASVLKKSAGAGHYSQDEEYEPADPTHPLCRILEEPGGPYGEWAMNDECEHLALQYLLTGEAPVWCPVNEAGRPVRFFALTSALVTPLFGFGANPQYPQGAWRVMPYGGLNTFSFGGMQALQAILPAEEVRRFKTKHPWARNIGYSMLQAGAKEIDVLEAITQARWSYFDTGLMLDTVVMMPGANEEAVKAFGAGLTQSHGGVKNARRVLVAGGSGMEGTAGAKFDIKQLNPGAREMDFSNGYDQTSGVGLAFYRVPKSSAGLTSATNYSGLFAEKQQLREYALNPFFLRFGGFLTHTLARPWSEEPGQFKIECELPPLGDLEMDEKQFEFDCQQGILTQNQALKRRNMKPVGPDGELPVPVYLAKQQQAIAPPPQPGMPQGDPNDPNAAAPGGDEQQPGAEDQQDDDSPEATQDAVTGAALQALGVPPDDESADEPDAVAKALGPPTKPGGVASVRHKRAEGEVWTGADGKKWTKRGGKIVAATLDRAASDFGKKKIPTARPVGSDPKTAIAAHLGVSGGAKKPAPRPAPSSPAPASGAHPGGLVDVRGVIAKHGGDADQAAEAIRARLSGHLAAGGKASLWLDGKQIPVGKVENGAVYDTKGQRWGMLPLAAGSPGTKTGVEFHPVEQPGGAPVGAPPTDPGANHDRLAAQLLRGRSQLNFQLLGANGKYVAHPVRDGASLKAFLDKGGKLPPAAFQEAAKAVPVATPVAQQTVSTVKQWAAGRADQHADRVAAHFGITRERAHALLVQAIVAVARHAEQGGGNARATIRDPRTGRSVTLAPKKPAPGGKPTGATPTGGTVPRPANAAAKGSRPPQVAKAMSACDDSTGGALVPPAVARRRKKRKPLAELSRAVLKALDTRG